MDKFLQTSNSNIYAVGDCAKLPLRLETTAGREGTLAVENAFENRKEFIEYSAVPYTVFTDPELAGVGLTEEEQAKKYGACSCRVLDFKNLPKAGIEKRIEGYARVVVHPQTEKVEGFHILSERASELIFPASIFVKKGFSVKEVAEAIPIFPSYSEVFKYLALSFYKDVSKLSCCV